MNKRGFTIIELLLVLLIIGIVFVSASIGINHIVAIKEEKESALFVNQLERAACVLIDLDEYQLEKRLSNGDIVANCRRNGLCIVSSKDLIDAGLINKSIIEDSKKGKTEYLIKVSWEDGLKQCLMQME